MMTRREKRAHRDAYRLRLAERYSPDRLTENLLWQTLRAPEYQAAMACTIRRQPGRLEELIGRPVPDRLARDVHAEYVRRDPTLANSLHSMRVPDDHRGEA